MYGCESWTIKKAEHQRVDPVTNNKEIKMPMTLTGKIRSYFTGPPHYSQGDCGSSLRKGPFFQEKV